MHIGSKIQAFKLEKIHLFFLFQKYQWFYPLIPEECGLHKIFSILIIAIIVNLVCPAVLRIYGLRKYLNTVKARSQASINKHNLTYGMCCNALCLIPIATDIAKKILLGRRYDEPLFICSKFVGMSISWVVFLWLSLWNQYNILHSTINNFSCRI